MPLPCDPKQLVALAKCFDCIPHNARRWVRSYLLCNAAASGGMSPPLAIGQITNFNFISSSVGQAIAVWDTPPVAATGTELWTSPDNITFSLAATIASPGGGTIIAPPAVGSFMWGKARWVSAKVQGAFSSTIEISGRACDWAARVVTNGGGGTSLTTRMAMNTFDLALVAGALDSQLIYLLPFADNLIAGITPLYKVAGADPASNQGPFVAADFSVNGLKGDGTKYLNTLIAPNAGLTLNSNCVFLYESVAQTNVGELSGSSSGGFVDGLLPNDQNNGALTNYFSQNQLVSTAPILRGFYLGSRVNNTDQRLFFANSTNAWAQVGATQAAAGAGLGPQNLTVFALNAAGTPINKSDGALSIYGLAKGLTSAQGQTLFNAVQAFRTTLGGGFL